MPNGNADHRHRPTPEPRRRIPEPAQVEPDEDGYDYEPSAADAQEAEAEGHYITAPLAGKDVRVVPPGAWRQSWQRQLQQGLTDQFAEHVIHPDDVDLYYEIDPTNEEFGDFVAEAARLSGESLGKSRGPVASSRRTRRR
ncbi:hypothetical protein ABTX82_01845 [Streptomyces lavendulae]|uniref:hypothetical protein n=1 Tax=Streptomyces lavendulae TaxID=1914 RepID=UPI00333361A0